MHAGLPLGGTSWSSMIDAVGPDDDESRSEMRAFMTHSTVDLLSAQKCQDLPTNVSFRLKNSSRVISVIL